MTTTNAPVEETQETLTAYNDGPPASKTITDAVLPTISLDEATLKEAKVHEIRNFLARPILLETVSWNVTHTPNAVLSTITNPTALFTQANNRTKIAGFFGYKGTMVVTITVNGTRFMQGLLMLHYLPHGDLVSNPRVAVANSNLVFKSQQPHIVYDVAMDSEVSLAIPWMHAKPFMEVAEYTNLGSFYLSVYSGLVSPSGDTTASVNVWAHLEDVDLEFPGVMISQSGRPVRRSRGGKEQKGGASVEDRELAGVGMGPVSSVFSKISGAAGVLSAIPSISAIAGPASWLTAILSDAAAAAGWSNPSQSSPVGKIMPARLAYSANVNGVDNSIRMGAFADNQVEALPGFGGTDDDELSISKIVQRSAYFYRFTYSTADSAGSRIASFRVSPGACQTATITTPGAKVANFRLETPLSYISNLFQYWRGSICFKIRLVKTEFHSGRLLIAFTPGKASAPTTISATTSLYREIYDIADSNEINLCFPYVSTKPWTECMDYVGTFSIFNLSALRAPPTVSNTITLIMEVSGGDDMQFAIPATNRTATPVHAIMAAQSGGLNLQDYEAFLSDLYPRPMLSQGLGVNELSSKEPADMAMMPGGFASCKMGSGDLAPQRFCIGEAILSLRQLLKRSVAFLSLGAGLVEFEFDPFLMFIPFVSASTVEVSSSWSVDYFSTIGQCFAFGRGGVRIKMYQTGSTGDVLVRGYVSSLKTEAHSWSSTHSAVMPSLDVIVPIKMSMSGAAEIEVPQYTPSYARVHWHGAGYNPNLGNTAAGNEYGSPFRLKWSVTDKTAPTTWLRQGADDTDFGCWIGVLPTLVNIGSFSTYGTPFGTNA